MDNTHGQRGTMNMIYSPTCLASDPVSTYIPLVYIYFTQSLAHVHHVK